MKRKFKSVQDLETKIKIYFEKCKKDKQVPTICGLAVSLDTNRQTLLNYSNKPGYLDTIKRAKAIIEAFQAQLLVNSFGNKNVTGIIFSLKNNFGWKDKHELVETLTLKPEDKSVLDKYISSNKIGRDTPRQSTQPLVAHKDMS